MSEPAWKVRKKPVIVEAAFFDQDKKTRLPWEFYKQLCRCISPGSIGIPEEWMRPWHIHTLEGPMIVRDGDWIIKGVRGEFYPIKAEIFKETYERVEE